MNASKIIRSENRRVVIALVCAVSITLYLFYIDEGYYDFRWMAIPGNWIPFFFYMGTLLGFQLLISEVVLGRCSARVKLFSTVLIACTLLIFLLIAFRK